jgi:hypothetical protein
MANLTLHSAIISCVSRHSHCVRRREKNLNKSAIEGQLLSKCRLLLQRSGNDQSSIHKELPQRGPVLLCSNLKMVLVFATRE